ncbi:MAG: nuclease [Alphaproteobacteria bacterium]|nr:nuclease [Alphaproteobacteria bacterium]
MSLAFTTCALADPCEAPLPKKGETFSGPVTYIVDGDGLCVGEEQGGIEVRLADFRAIELNDPGGREAKAALTRIAFGKTVSCVAGKHSWDRVVARCTLNGEGLGDLMRAAGIPEGGR